MSDPESYGDGLARNIALEISDLLKDRLDHFDTFNIVVFGRTGVGKSTLIEALSEGDGERISPGEINHTVEAESVSWKDCSLWDVPGIDGQDGRADTGALELNAKQKVAIADIVLLCFKTDSQEEGAFKKIGDWIAAYGKPAIAVLNVDNPIWRYSSHPFYSKRHRDICHTNGEHAARIGEELAGIGMFNAPIVAVHSLDAAFAQASLPWKGPWPDDLELRRIGAGDASTLAQWSNLPALQELFTEAILANGATTLRLGSLVLQIDGALRNGEDHLRLMVESAFLKRSEQAERGIEQLLALLGAPEAVLGDMREYRKLRQAIAELERLRGGRFAAPQTGRAAQYAESRIVAAFSSLRADAHRRADAVVDNAMIARRPVKPDAFAEAVFDSAELEAAAVNVGEEIVAYLGSRIGRAFDDIARDLFAVEVELARARIDGQAGKGWRWTSGTAKILGPVASIGASVIALNWWNPLGWATGATLIVGALVNVTSVAVGWWTGRTAAGRREAALSRARTDARSAVDGTFDRIQKLTAECTDQVIQNAFLAAVGPVSENVLAWRRAVVVAARRRELLAAARVKLPSVSDTAELLGRAMVQCEQRIVSSIGVPPSAAGPYLWMGESWRADRSLAGVPEKPRAGRAGKRSRRRAPGARRLRSASLGLFAVPRPGSGRRWLAEAHQRLVGDPDAGQILGEIDRLAASRTPRVVLAGGYNSGKSSFIRRLLVESGQSVPTYLRVGGNVTTRSVDVYEWGGVALVDVPGFQSGRAGHDAAALSEVADAAAVIYLLGQGLSGLDYLVRILTGDPGHAMPRKFGRTIIVLNRCDQIAPDYAVLPDEHMEARERKRIEAAEAIKALAAERGHDLGSFEPDGIICTASAPYGDWGDHPAAFDPYRSFDGFGEFERAFFDLLPGLAANGVDVSILHGGIARLNALAARAHERELELGARSVQLGRLRQDAADALAVGRAIRDSCVDRLARRAGDYLEGELNKALLIKDPERRRLTVKRLDSWTTAREVRKIVHGWYADSADEVSAWEVRTDQAIRRRFESKSFQVALAVDLAPVPLAFLRRGTSTGLAVVAEAGSKLGGALKALDEPTLLTIMAKLGQAALSAEVLEKVLTVATRVGAGTQLFAAGGQVALLVQNYIQGRDEDDQRRVAGQRLREQAAQWARRIAIGSEKEPGALSPITACCDDLERDIRELDRQIELSHQGAVTVAGRRASYAALISTAEERLRISGEERT